MSKEDGTPNILPVSNIAYVYDGSTEGLLSAVFLAYANHENPQDIIREGSFQLRLDQSVVYIETNAQHAERVRKGVIRKSNKIAWEIILDASLSDDPQAGTAIYRLIRLIMSRPAKQNAYIRNELTDPIVGPVLKLHHAVRNERHFMQELLRFEHFDNDLWFAKCNPNANVVPLLMDWFSARFNTQQFVIYDEVHNIAGIYDGESWALAETNELDLPAHSSDEAVMQNAWKRFYDAVSIPARYHPELRRQHMPKRFWKNILEVRDEEPLAGTGRSLPQPTRRVLTEASTDRRNFLQPKPQVLAAATATKPVSSRSCTEFPVLRT